MMSVSSVYLSSLSFTRPIEIPATGWTMGTPASIRPAWRCRREAIELEPFDSVMSEIMRIVYGNVLGRGKHALDRSLGEAAVADFASARSADRPHLTHRVGGEVIVQHEAVRDFAEETVDALLIAGRAEHRPFPATAFRRG